MDGGARLCDAAPPRPRKDRRRQESAPAAGGPIAQQRAGHRERLRRHFLENLPGEIRMRDYELLELLLFGAYPRRDVQPIARDLIRKFDSVAGVLAAEPSALKEVKHVGEVAVSLIKVAGALGIELARQRALGGDLLDFIQRREDIDLCEAIRQLEGERWAPAPPAPRWSAPPTPLARDPALLAGGHALLRGPAARLA